MIVEDVNRKRMYFNESKTPGSGSFYFCIRVDGVGI